MFKNEKGFTILEVVLGIVILAVGLTSVLAYFTQGMQNSSYAQNISVATILAQDLMEEIKSKCWDPTATTVPPCSGAVTPSFPIGPSIGQTRATYNAVDDFNGLNNTPPINSQGALMPNPYNNMAVNTFKQSVSVCYVAAGTLDTCIASPGTSNFKRIVVTISWGSVTGDQVQLVSVVTNH